MRKLKLREKLLVIVALFIGIGCVCMPSNKAQAVTCTHLSKTCWIICMTPYIWDERVDITAMPIAWECGEEGEPDLISISGNCGDIYKAGMWSCTRYLYSSGNRSSNGCTYP